MPYSEPPTVHLEPLETQPRSTLLFTTEPPTVHLEPLETQPQHVVVYDRTARRWAVRLSNTGVWVGLLRGASPGSPRFTPGTRLVTALDPDSARNLADALTWAASLAVSP